MRIGPAASRRGARLARMLTDAEAEEIRRGLAAGVRGPVLITWCEQLLRDRTERVAREREKQGLERGQLRNTRHPRHAFRSEWDTQGE